MSFNNKCFVYSIYYLCTMCFYFLLEALLLTFYSKKKKKKGAVHDICMCKK